MNGGQVILADEPTGALDSHSGEEVMAILKQLCAQGHTVILVTHDPAVARQAERIIEIRDGEIIADSRPAPQENAQAEPLALAAAAASWRQVGAASAKRWSWPGARWRPTRCAPR